MDRLVATPLSETLLVTDFDGTLAPIVAEPATARALPASLDALATLVGLGLKVVVLSGRPTSFLETYVPIPGVRLMGDNGLERISPEEIAALERFNAMAASLMTDRPGVRVVANPGSTSVHFRAAPEAGAGLFADVSSLASRVGLGAVRGRMVVEVRPERGTKAHALDALIVSMQPRCLVFAGDDEGDRDAFELLAGLAGAHLAIGIRSDETASDLFTLCDVVLDSPAALAVFLAAWIEAARGSKLP